MATAPATAIVSWGFRGDPSYRCNYCLAVWYLPRKAEGEAEHQRSTERAIHSGWLLIDDHPPVCPDCTDVHHRLTRKHEL